MNAVVTGATRGVGRGVVLALASRGYGVTFTGRNRDRIRQLEEEIAPYGVECRGVVCDHSSFDETVRVAQDLADEPLDLLVNNVWDGYARMVEDGAYTWERKFWEQPDHRWFSMMDVGVRSVFLFSKYLAPSLFRDTQTAIINISFWAAQTYLQNVIYGASKAAVDKLTSDMAVELRETSLRVVSLYPGLVRTESVLENAAYFDMTNSESPEFVGLVCDGLVRDPKLTEKSGGFFTTAELAREYGIVDIDGKTIRDVRMA